MSFLIDNSSSNSLNNELESETDNGRKMSLREKTRQATARIQKLKDDLDFMADFDPEKSKREKRKLRKSTSRSQSSKYSLYDEKGRLRALSLDICDCLNEDCSGCFFPCPNCKNTKCGPTCRVNRKFAYDIIEFDGNNTIIKNNYFFMRK